MARKRRIIYPGYCYHVMIRGVGGRTIFSDDQDRVRFCLLLQYASETSQFNVHGFCLMSNHAHLILQPLTEDLSSGMHRLTFRYAQHFNKKVKRQGYLFQGRYRAIIVQHGIYLRRLIRYIHRNPVRASLVSKVSNYPWSSHQAYTGDSKYTWLNTGLILSLFSSEQGEALEAFNKYVFTSDEEAKNELEEIRKSVGIGAYGNELFVKEFQETLETASETILGVNVKEERPIKENAELNFGMIADALIKTTKVTLEEMRSPDKKAEFVDARAILVWLVLTKKLGSRKDLTLFLLRDPTSIARLYERAKRFLRLRDLAEKTLTSILF